MKKINFSPLICFLFIIVLLASCMRRKDKRLYGCVYDITTGKLIQKERDLTLAEYANSVVLIPIVEYYDLKTNSDGCYDIIMELGKTEYELGAHILTSQSDNESFAEVPAYQYSLSKIKSFYIEDFSTLPNDKNLEYYGDAKFKIDRDGFKRKNKDIEINFGFILHGKLKINLTNTSQADSITVYAKNTYFEDVIFSNSNTATKASREYWIVTGKILLRYEVIKNGITTTTTEEVEIEEAKLTSVTHNY